MTDLSFDDLASEVADSAETVESTADTGEWITELVKTLDKRGLLEPILFGPEQAAEMRAEPTPTPTPADPDESGGVELDAEGIATAGREIMAQLGDDVTVAELVEICEANPALVDQQIAEHL